MFQFIASLKLQDSFYLVKAASCEDILICITKDRVNLT